jgi:hypothetical protein
MDQFITYLGIYPHPDERREGEDAAAAAVAIWIWFVVKGAWMCT